MVARDSNCSPVKERSSQSSCSATPGGRELSLYERDFLEGLALQTAVALENAINHKRHLEYARLAQDLDAARAIQQSLLPQAMPSIPGFPSPRALGPATTSAETISMWLQSRTALI